MAAQNCLTLLFQMWGFGRLKTDLILRMAEQISIQEVRDQLRDPAIGEFSISFINADGKIRTIARGITGTKDKYKGRTTPAGPSTGKKMYSLKDNYITLVRDLDIAHDPRNRDEGIRAVRLDRLITFNGKKVRY